ncbi:MAG: hypothetical protein HON76_18150 [Candidatus Scalindua sp.]|nr:hypothetical protein [Candidatus Scalindua sp.]MBT6048201.1 hypothetical protein [Candidatus Scalindua sp.]MBT6225385.1 hypothetical protein [Candidatus Scalindua sp.]MBT6564444.1 hypothetical protein [Candidatus Scalindua sp.]MBT7591984.1 hypothetical protein [Candidatus Scalindua sp.]
MPRTPTERLRMVSRMYDSSRKLVISSIKSEGGKLSSSQLCVQPFLRIYGSDFTVVDRKKIINKPLTCN